MFRGDVDTHLDAYFFVYTSLLFFDLLFQLLEGGGIWGSSVCFEDLDVSGGC
jgi:hypothetical protein